MFLVRSEFGIAKELEVTEFLADLCLNVKVMYELSVALFSFDT